MLTRFNIDLELASAYGWTMHRTEVTWRKSTRSSDKANCVEVGWRKSSRSSSSAHCVEVGGASGSVYVRDTKDRSCGTLSVSADAWTAFLSNVKANKLNQ